MPSDEGFNIWGVVSGALGVLALLRLAWICSQFPSRKLHAVETLMNQTRDRFWRDYKEGLYSDERLLTEFNLRFWQLHSRMDDLKTKADALDTWFAQFGGWRSGLTKKICSVRQNVKALLVDLIEHSSRERKRLASEGYPQGLGKYLSVQNQERRKSIMMFAIPDDQSAGLPRPMFANDGESSPPRVHSPTPLPLTAQNVISRAGASDPPPSVIPVSVDSDANPDVSLQTQSSSGPQTFPAPNMRRDQRAARREVLCQYARQSYGSASASLPPRDGLAPSRKKRRRMRFKHFLEKVSDIMKEAAAAMDDDDDDDDDYDDDYDSDDSADDYDHPV
ncbi:hypothetical protein C2E23DRAFT_533831 [Lenzites betulinus]|nr:hypothetical protein C2E23DRAFT_533831 [Lenzites betulinus]